MLEFAGFCPGAGGADVVNMLVKLKCVLSPLMMTMLGSFRTSRLISTRFLNSGRSLTFTTSSLARTNGSVPYAGSSLITTSSTRAPMPGQSVTPTSPTEMSRPVCCLTRAKSSPFRLLMILLRLAATTTSSDDDHNRQRAHDDQNFLLHYMCSLRGEILTST